MRPLIAALRGAARRRHRDERGAVMVIVSVALVALLGMAALAIDLSSFYKAQRQAQSAADAGALAAAWDLPFNTVGAQSDGTTIASTNYPGSSPTVTINPSGTMPNSVKVTVNASSPSFFGTLFGLTKANITASATAGGQGTVAQGSIFAYASGGTDCSQGITIKTNNDKVLGGIESNGTLDSSSTNNQSQFTTGTYGTGCSFKGSTSTWTTPPFQAKPSAWPIYYSTANGNLPACTITYTGTSAISYPSTTFPTPSLTPTSSSIVMCAPNASLTVNGNVPNTCTPSTTQLSCPGVTFEAAQITVSGSGTISAPYSNGAYGLLFDQTGSDTSPGGLSLSANSTQLNGTTFAPNATITVSGNSSGTGFIEGNQVVLGGSNGGGGGGGSSGNGFTITGDGPPIASNGYALLQ